MKRKKPPVDPFLKVDITSIGYRMCQEGPNGYGNPYRGSFASTVSRSPRTNVIHIIPDTQKTREMGPGYYEI